MQPWDSSSAERWASAALGFKLSGAMGAHAEPLHARTAVRELAHAEAVDAGDIYTAVRRFLAKQQRVDGVARCGRRRPCRRWRRGIVRTLHLHGGWKCGGGRMRRTCARVRAVVRVCVHTAHVVRTWRNDRRREFPVALQEEVRERRTEERAWGQLASRRRDTPSIPWKRLLGGE